MAKYTPGIYQGLGEYVILTRVNDCLEMEFLAPAFDHPKGGPVTNFVAVSHIYMEAIDFRRCYRRTPVTRVPKRWLKPLRNMAKYLHDGGYNEVLSVMLDLETRIEEVSND